MRLLLTLLSIALLAGAQDSASLSGDIRDASDRLIPGTSIVATNVDSGRTRNATANAEGHFLLTILPLGHYELRASKDGFKTSVTRGLELTVGQQATVNLRMEVGTVSQQIVVYEAAPLVSVSMDETEGLVQRREIRNLPLNGRSYDQLLTLDPGIVNYTSQKTGGVGISNSAVANMFAAVGRRPQENLFLVDGVEYTGSAEINMTPGGTSGELLGVDAIREFNVLTDAYGSEYGKRPGAQVVISTQSGTNQLHGSAYEFLRNSFFDARNFFDRKNVPGFQRNQFGAALGGPLRKNKTFLFGNYEGFRQRLGLSDVTLVPDDNARNGFVPSAAGPLVHVGVSPASARLLNLWPLQNGPELGSGIAEAFSSPKQKIREDFGTARFDQIMTGKDTLFASYTVDDSADNTPTANPLSLDIESLREQVVSLGETHVFSPSLVNALNVGFSRASYVYTGKPAVDAPGFIAGQQVGAVVIGGNATPNTPSQITLGGSNYGSNLFAARNLFTVQDSLSIVHGIHQINAGVWLQRIQSNDRLALGQYGQANFANIQDFLTGSIATFTAVPSATPLGWRSLEAAWYVTDQMQLRPDFSLTLGFRAEFTNGWNEVTGRAANFVFGPDGALETQPHVGSSALSKNYARFLPQPRVGIAWAPLGGNRTVIRAGFGLYNDLQDALSYRLDQNAPFNSTLTLKNINLSSLPLTPGVLPGGGLIAPAGIQPDLRTPTVIAYTFKLEQLIASDTLLSLGYSGSHAYHEILSLDYNLPYPAVCPASPCPANLPSGTTYYKPGSPLANPKLANTWTWASQGNSTFNALTVNIHRRLAAGFEIRGAYTWSKTIDNGDTLNGSAAANAPGLVMDARNINLDRGLATFDVRHLAAVAATYELPFGPGRRFFPQAGGFVRKLVEGWAIDGIETAHSGFPFTPELSFNPSNDGNTQNPVRPSLNPAFTGNIITGTPNHWFNPNAFVVPANGTYGNLGRNVLIGPGSTQLDVSLRKDTPLAERASLQLRAEAFNVFNHANFNTPNLITYTSAAALPSGSAGVITSTSTSSRQIQVSAKLIW